MRLCYAPTRVAEETGGQAERGREERPDLALGVDIGLKDETRNIGAWREGARNGKPKKCKANEMSWKRAR
eukprot:3981097-Pleurochrysis_carterae.AAC.1